MADIGYTYGYYTELNPLNTQLTFLYRGVAPPKIANACELGFGQGVSVNIHAAASNVRWWGTDFNPAQAGFAQDLASGSGAAANLFDESFEEFCARPDLPQMDYVGLHGIWSWISDENRAVIVDFLRRKLKVGGVLYISYNTQPGWAAMVPMRDLFVEHAAVMGSPGEGRVARVDAALAFAEKLLAANPGFARANPGIPERMKKVLSHNRNYVAHEYFNRDWEPMSFGRMAHWLGPAKLTYAGPANSTELVDAINLTAEQQALLKEIPDPNFRQTVRDFCVNQTFRRDYWVRGARALAPAEQSDSLRRRSVVLTTHPSEVTFKASGAQGEVALNESIYRPILELLADHTPRTIGELEQVLRPREVSFGQLVQALMVLGGKGAVYAAQDAATIDAARSTCLRLNRELMKAAKFGKDLSHLASPVTGGGISAPRFHQIFLQSAVEGKTQPDAWAQDAWAVLQSQNQKVVKDGKPLETPEENLSELRQGARDFQEKRLPILRSLCA
ncbi:MAG: methyltransferase regulatory domain-containing protein [Ramlibacter sp.]|nr:methyltransferase regulatory domain-containing protein [Ramlibacter sp.]